LWGDRLRASLAGDRYPPALIGGLIVIVIAAGLLGLGLGSATKTRALASPRTLAIDNPYQTPGNWYVGNLQVASVRGIGRDLPSLVGRWYADHGYAFLGISDLNTYTWTSEFSTAQLTGVPVVDASYPFGDLLAIGDDHWAPASTVQQAIDRIAADNALPVLTASSAQALGGPAVLGLHRLFGLEIDDARLTAQGQSDLAGLWDQLLSTGNRVYAFAGDDVTSLQDLSIGHAWIDVEAPVPGHDALLSSLRLGAFVASTGPAFTSIAVQGRTITAAASPGTSLRFIGRSGRVLEAAGVSTASYTVTGSETYVRIEALATDGTRAWSQPLFLAWH
jgi:hypothetical protein